MRGVRWIHRHFHSIVVIIWVSWVPVSGGPIRSARLHESRMYPSKLWRGHNLGTRWVDSKQRRMQGPLKFI